MQIKNSQSQLSFYWYIASILAQKKYGICNLDDLEVYTFRVLHDLFPLDFVFKIMENR